MIFLTKFEKSKINSEMFCLNKDQNHYYHNIFLENCLNKLAKK